MSLTPDDEDLLGRARGGLGPSAADRARLRAAIGASLAGTSTIAAGAVATKSGLLVKVVVGVVAVAALAGGAVAALSSEGTRMVDEAFDILDHGWRGRPRGR